MDTIFSAALNGVAQAISTLESFEDSQGINISNWIVQLVGNNTVDYELSLNLKFKDNSEKTVKIPSGFMPANTKRDSQSYIGLIRSGNLENPDIESYCLIGYFLSSMILGKIPSIVNSGRGWIVERMFKELNILDCNFTIHKYSSGGKDKPHDLEYNYPELKSLVKFFSERAKRILALNKRSGKTDKVTAIGKRNIEVI
jgi:hypothetical protein